MQLNHARLHNLFAERLCRSPLADPRLDLLAAQFLFDLRGNQKKDFA
jgi:hypothetical protein